MLKKINFIGNVDPYEVPKDQWIRDPDALPPVTFPDIFTYFVCGVSAYTAEQFRNYIYIKFVLNMIALYIIQVCFTATTFCTVILYRCG